MKKILLGILVLLSALTQANAITTREQCNSKINSINSSIKYLNRQRGGPCQWSMYVKQILDNTDIVRKHCWSILDEDGKFWIRSLTREMKSKPMCGSDYHSKYTPRGYWSKTTDSKPKLPSGLDIEGYDRPMGSKPTQKEASKKKTDNKSTFECTNGKIDKTLIDVVGNLNQEGSSIYVNGTKYTGSDFGEGMGIGYSTDSEPNTYYQMYEGAWHVTWHVEGEMYPIEKNLKCKE